MVWLNKHRTVLCETTSQVELFELMYIMYITTLVMLCR